MKLKIYTLVLLVFLLSACQSQPAFNPTPVILPTAAAQTATPTAVSLPPMSTSVNPPTSALTSIPTQPVVWKNNLERILKSPCLEVLPGLTEYVQINYDFVVKGDQGYFVLDPVSQQKTSMKSPHPTIKFSPDGKWVAYLSGGTLMVEPVENLIKADHKQRIEWKKYDYIQLIGWLSGDKIILIRKDEKRSASTIIYNPITQDDHVYFLEDFPKAKSFTMTSTIMPYMFTQYNLLPSPTLKQMIFVGNETDNFSNVSLWDIKSNKILGKLSPFMKYIGNDPIWSHDGSDFVMASDWFDWYQVKNDGKVRQLTRFGDFLERVIFINASRSSDGRYLSFELIYKTLDGVEGQKYLILDLKTDAADGFCVEAAPHDNPDFHTMIWSPDSKYLAISDVTYQTLGNVILVDVDKKQSYLMTKDASVKGWLVKP
jgi:Tol biopolymer transport system component